jgi:superfamily II DNA or RNA helicase
MIIRDKIYINTVELGYRLNDLCTLFTYKNPEIFQKKKLKLSIKNTPLYLKHYKLTPSTDKTILELPRGGLSRLRKFLEENRIAYRILDQRKELPPINIKLQNTILEEQQLSIIKALKANEGGLIEVPPGAGKTIAALGLIAEIKQPTLIIMHEHRLSNQWIGEIRHRLAGNYTLGKYDGEVKEMGDIVVAIINSTYNKFQEDADFFDNFGMIIIDETHHVPAHMYTTVINNIPAKYRIGMTGTIKRKDKKEIILYDILGDPTLEIGAEKLKHRISDFSYKVVNTNLRIQIPTKKRWTGKKREEVLDIVGCITKLVENDNRNDIILSEAVCCIKDGYFPLILSDRVNHNKLLYERLKTMGYNVALLIGETRKNTNWEEIRKDEAMQCIVANSKIASEGLDLPKLSALILTCPSSNPQKLKQQIGRIRRVHPGKPMPLVIDICDNLAFYLDEQSNPKYLLSFTAKNRVRLYNTLKKEYMNG